MSRLLGQACHILIKPGESSNKALHFQSPSPGLPLAYMCFYVNYKKALLLCWCIEIGTPPSTSCQGQCSENKTKAVFMSVHSHNCMSLHSAQNTVSVVPLLKLPFTIFQTWNPFCSPYPILSHNSNLKTSKIDLIRDT